MFKKNKNRSIKYPERTTSLFSKLVRIYIWLTVASIVILLRHFNLFQVAELFAYDRFVSLNHKEQKNQELLLVEITDTDIQNQDRWPLSDSTLANLLGKLQEAQPATIGLDIYRDIAHPPGTKALQKQLQRSNVISIKYLGNGDNRIAPPVGVSPQQIGFNDVVLDWDGTLRRSLLYARLPETELYSFSLRLALAYLEARNPGQDFKVRVDDRNLFIGDKAIPRLLPNSGNYHLTASETLGWQVLIDYQPSDSIAKVNLTDVLEGKIDPNLVKNKIVVVGTTAPSINDFFDTPYGGTDEEIAGAIIHGLVASQIVSLASGETNLRWFLPEVGEWLWIGLWSFGAMTLVTKTKNPSVTLLLSGSGILLLGGVCFAAFALGGWLPLTSTAIAFGATTVAILCDVLWRNSRYDTLTSLPNQVLFFQQLKKLRSSNLAKAPDSLLVVQCLDLDRFKTINDALGYKAGDLLLKTIAQRLRSTLNRNVLVARVGNDEFAIATIIQDEAVALDILEQIRSKLSEPLDLSGLKTSTQIATGIAVQNVSDSLEPKALLRSARTAMYRAKASGKVSHQVFASQMHENALKRLQLEADLHRAIENEEFQLYYQPIIDLQSENIAGFEALIRWISPVRGFVSPGAFIPVAEETGAIVPIGEWVLKEACQQMASWQQEFPNLADCFMSVNLSIGQFSQPNLVEKIQETLELTGLVSSSLKLEITESMVMENVEEAIAILERLKALQIKLSMDDFGTGFSSFSYLHRFPMDTLKIDRSFVSNMNKSQKNLEIVSTIALLARKLGMDIVAEGIEEEAEKKALQALKCEYGQGYFFAKPLPVSEINSLISKPSQLRK